MEHSIIVTLTFGKLAQTRLEPRKFNEVNFYEEDSKKIYIDICTGENYSEFENQSRSKIIDKIYDPTQFHAITTIIKISILLVLIEIFLNHSSNIAYSTLENLNIDKTSLNLVILSLLSLTLLLIKRKKGDEIEITQIRKTISAIFNENEKASLLSSRLAKKIASKDKEIEVWIHKYSINHWTIKGLVKNLIQHNRKGVTLHLKTEDSLEITTYLYSSLHSILFHKLNMENQEPRRKWPSIHRTYGKNSEVIIKCIKNSILHTVKKKYLSLSRLRLEIEKSLPDVNILKLVNDLKNNYNLLDKDGKHYLTTINLEEDSQANDAHTKLSESPDIPEILLEISSEESFKKLYKLNIILNEKILEDEDYNIFIEWLSNSQNNLNKYKLSITPRSAKNACNILINIALYEKAQEICDDMMIFNREEYKALSSLIQQRQETSQNRSSSKQLFSQIDENKLFNENKIAYIEYLLHRSWSLLDQDNLLQNEINEATFLNDRALHELNKNQCIYPDLQWHYFNNHATAKRKNGDFISSIDMHKKASTIIGCSEKWRSGSLVNIAIDHLNLYRISHQQDQLNEARSHALKGYEIKNSIGDKDEIEVAKRVLIESIFDF